jgi:uncharacterized protein YbjT (DUF2867 family)
MNFKTALIIGSTGLTGQECLKLLLESDQYNKVIALNRAGKKIAGNTAAKNNKLETVFADFSHLNDYKDLIKAEDVYCAIGTTIAKAGSQEAFRHVDFDIPFTVAQIAKLNGAKKFILVSSLGANSNSGVFYNRVKGELEDALTKLNYGSLIIFRPSILLGERKETRSGEAVGQFIAGKFAFLFSGPLKKYRGMPVSLLAKAMVKSAAENWVGTRIIENSEIFTLTEG